MLHSSLENTFSFFGSALALVSHCVGNRSAPAAFPGALNMPPRIFHSNETIPMYQDAAVTFTGTTFMGIWQRRNFWGEILVMDRLALFLEHMKFASAMIPYTPHYFGFCGLYV